MALPSQLPDLLFGTISRTIGHSSSVAVDFSSASENLSVIDFLDVILGNSLVSFSGSRSNLHCLEHYKIVRWLVG